MVRADASIATWHYILTDPVSIQHVCSHFFLFDLPFIDQGEDKVHK